MAETPLKRQREETQVEDEESSKHHKSYNHILSLLEADEEEPNQDISSLVSTLQQELSSGPLLEPTSESDPDNPTVTTTLDSISSSPILFKGDEEEADKESVIRHLLEASDDELGIPHRETRVDGEEDDESNDGGFGLSLCDGLWEFEDETANYYTLLQSEIFM
ncbi:hypothetical protein HHK36_015315 [Tetracentron sinense]|uniref:Uncharacterized protein n=1 Tax=Tetracentron sinense TaxID=13715 RepID=A0A834Z4X4_TETSI|nr:hypothetical protein HHK36_015315 [Tetracentron sinense]